MELDENKEAGVKKSPFDDMSKDDLIKKCKNMLIIVQKSKLAKEEIQAENTKLKCDFSVSKEMLEALMEQKIDLTQKLDEFKRYKVRVDDLENENESFKRQNKRVTDENDELLKHLETLENKITELNEIGLQQQNQLLTLLDSKDTSKLNREDSGLPVSPTTDFKLVSARSNTEKAGSAESKEWSELQSMLAISLGEIKTLRAQKESCEQEYEETSRKLVAAESLIRDLNTKLSEVTESKEVSALEFKNCTADLQNARLNAETHANALVRDLEKSQYELKQKITHCKQLEDELNTLQTQCSDRNTDIEQFAVNKNNMLHEIEMLSQQLAQKVNAEKIMKEKFDELTNQSQISKEATENSVQEIGKLNNNISNLNEKLIQLESENKLLKENISKLNVEIDQSHILHKNSNTNLEEIQVLNEKYKSKLQNYRSKLIKLANVAKELRNTKQSLLETAKEYQTSVVKWQQEINQVVKMMSDNASKTTSEKFAIEDEYNKLQNDLKSLTEELRTVDEERLQVIHTQKEMLEKLQNIESIKTGLEIKCKDLEQVSTNLQAAHNQLKDDKLAADNSYKDIVIEQQRIENHCAEIEVKLVQKNREYDNLCEELTDKNNIISELKNRESELLNAIDDINIKYRDASQIMANRVKDLEESSGEMNLNLQLLTDTVLKLKSIIESSAISEQVLDDTNKIIEKVEIEKMELIKTLEECAGRYETEMKSWSDERSEFLAQLSELQREIDLRGENSVSDEQTKIQTEMMQTIKHLKETKSILEGDLEKERIELKTEKEKCNELIKHAEEVNIKINTLRAENDATNLLCLELKKTNQQLSEKVQLQTTQNETQLFELQEKYSENCEIINELNQKLELQSFIENELQELKHTNADLAAMIEAHKKDDQIKPTDTNLNELMSGKIIIKELTKQNETNVQKISTLENENANLGIKLGNIKKENTELLSEMNEMVQELKKRGENLSKEQEINSDLSKTVDRFRAEVHTLQVQIKQKEDIIKNMDDEIENLKERINNMDFQNDSLSTSTISRSDEGNRLLELEGPWEERYNKLKHLAVRLKKRSVDLNEQLQVVEADRNALKIELSEKILEMQKNTTNPSSSEKSSGDKQKLQNELEILRKEKINSGNVIKEFKNEIRALKKDGETEAQYKKDFENKLLQIENDLKQKDLLLQEEISKHKSTKEQLSKSNKECKKRSVLSLEMEDYERSLKEVSEKLDTKQVQITSLEATIDTQSSTISALREQIRSLDDTVKLEESQVKELKTQLNESRANMNQTELQCSAKDAVIAQLEASLETEKETLEELKIQLAKSVGETQKFVDSHKNERDHLRGIIFGLEEKIRHTSERLNTSELEVARLTDEFDGYKVRATSALRQNQANGGPDFHVLRLSEETTDLRAQLQTTQARLESETTKLKCLSKEYSILEEDRNEFEKRSQELISILKSLRTEHDDLLELHSKQVSEHNEALRAQKIRNDTLAQCYRQQILELEEKNRKEIDELQNRLLKKVEDKTKQKLDKASTYQVIRFMNADDRVDVSCMEREECEGSESIDSGSSQLGRPLPLDQLLNSNIDGEIVRKISSSSVPNRAVSPGEELRSTKQQLVQHEARVSHLTGLLSDAEKDLAKLTQLNQILKEEIRRHQRSVEREQHAENLEYLKNVIFKFITLGSGDEKTHLVPVLNTILKLSPEESHKLNAVAKGIDPSSGRAWSSYLPLPKWPGA